jgi:hypothetical protein
MVENSKYLEYSVKCSTYTHSIRFNGHKISSTILVFILKNKNEKQLEHYLIYEMLRWDNFGEWVWILYLKF